MAPSSYMCSDMLSVFLSIFVIFFLVDASGEFTGDCFDFGSSVFKACSVQVDTS